MKIFTLITIILYAVLSLGNLQAQNQDTDCPLTFQGLPWSEGLETGKNKIMESIGRLKKLRNENIDGMFPSYLKMLVERVLVSPDSSTMSEIDAAERELRRMNLLDAGQDDEYARLAPIFLLVRKIYSEVDPHDEYTRLTDGEGQGRKGHYWIVAGLLERPATMTTVVGAFLHDLERFVPELKVAYEDLAPIPQLGGKNLDSVIRKEVIHPHRSAQVAMYLLQHSALTKKELKEVETLILYHDASAKGVEIRTSDQVSISLLPKVTDKVMKREIEALSDADASAFFYMTFPHFVERELKKMDKFKDQGDSRERFNLEENLKVRVVSTLFERISSRKQKDEALRLASNHIQNDNSHLDNFLKRIIVLMSEK